MLSFVLALVLQAPATDPVAAAATGLSPAEIEDDNGPDMPFLGASSAGCTVTIKGRDKSYTLDMTRTEALSREDTFVFVKAGDQQLAIVGDASKPDQSEKLTALARAFATVAQGCAKPGS